MSIETQTTLQVAASATEQAEAYSIKQLGLLNKRLLADPQSFRQLFVSRTAWKRAAWEFGQESWAAISSRPSGNCCCAATT